jgi:hypothetical protein
MQLSGAGVERPDQSGLAVGSRQMVVLALPDSFNPAQLVLRQWVWTNQICPTPSVAVVEPG